MYIGQAGFIYDALIDCVDQIKIVNPSKMRWIYRTSKKNDRTDARKMAVLLSIGEGKGIYENESVGTQTQDRRLKKAVGFISLQPH